MTDEEVVVFTLDGDEDTELCKHIYVVISRYSTFTKSAKARVELAELKLLQIKREYTGKNLPKLDQNVLSKKRVLTVHETAVYQRKEKAKTKMSMRQGRKKDPCLILYFRPVIY